MEMEIDDASQSDYTRTVDDVKSMIKLAKLRENQLTDLTQVIYYGENEADPDWRLLELNPDLLKAIEEKKDLSFKGGLHDSVVLCTDFQTFEVKEAGISNSLLLIPELKLAQATSRSPLKSPKNHANTSLERKNPNDSIESNDGDSSILSMERELEKKIVRNIFHEYFECREVKPRFRKLGDLLRLTQYSGPEREHTVDRSCLFTFDQLLDTTQCSRREFQLGLESFRAFEFENRMRVFDIEYEFRLLSLLLGVFVENSWDMDAVDRQTTLEAISETIAPATIIEKLFDLYTKPSEQCSSSAKQLYRYRDDLVCRTVALNILQQGSKFRYEEFMENWQISLPDGFLVQEEYLRGIAIVDTSNRHVTCVRTLIENNLTTKLVDRLNILFKTRDRWTLEEIKPYIEFFETPQLSTTAILAKYARAITENGQRVYVSRHGVRN